MRISPLFRTRLLLMGPVGQVEPSICANSGSLPGCNEVSQLSIDGAQSECVIGLMASSAGSPVGAETLKERPTQIDAASIAVGAGKTGEVEKRKEVAKVNVSDRGACGEENHPNDADHDSAERPAANRSTNVLTHFPQARHGTKTCQTYLISPSSICDSPRGPHQTHALSTASDLWSFTLRASLFRLLPRLRQLINRFASVVAPSKDRTQINWEPSAALAK